MTIHRLLLSAIMIIAIIRPLSVRADQANLETVAIGLIESINSGDTVARKSFLLANYINADSASAVERWQGHLQRWANRYGKIEIHSVDISDPQQPSILAHVSNSRLVAQWVVLNVNMDAVKTEKFRSLSAYPGRNPSIDLPDRPLTKEEITKHVSDFVDDLVARNVFSGTISLTENGSPFFAGAYGKADLRWGIDNKLDTKFNLGSMNKMFTGLAVCQLAAQGLVGFDSLVGKYIPDYPNKQITENVTVHHLLTHTSGMENYFDEMAIMDWTILRSVRDFAELSMEDSLAFDPGEDYVYSNAGPLVLGLIK